MRTWHIHRDGNALTLSRPGRARFDVGVTRALPKRRVSRRALAHQVRQDLWRALRQVRGFSPTVRVALEADRIEVTAGGALLDPRARTETLVARISALLDSPDHRRRWLNHAGRSC